MLIRILVSTCIAVGASFAARAQSVAPDTAEAGSMEEIAKATTEPRFSSPWVSLMYRRPPRYPRRQLSSAASRARPASWSTRHRPMLRSCARAASPRVKVYTIGRSEEGRDILLLAIADEKGIQNLDSLKAATTASASRDAARRRVIIGRGRSIKRSAAASDETLDGVRTATRGLQGIQILNALSSAMANSRMSRPSSDRPMV